MFLGQFLVSGENLEKQKTVKDFWRPTDLPPQAANEKHPNYGDPVKSTMDASQCALDNLGVFIQTLVCNSIIAPRFQKFSSQSFDAPPPFRIESS